MPMMNDAALPYIIVALKVYIKNIAMIEKFYFYSSGTALQSVQSFDGA